MNNKRKQSIPKYALGKGALEGINKGFNIAGDAASLLGLLGSNDNLNMKPTTSTQKGPIQWQKINELSMSDLKKGNVASGIGTTLGSAATGAKIGMNAGPLGAAIGGAAGAIGGIFKSIFGAKKRRNQLRKANEQIRQQNQFNFADAQSDLLSDEYYDENEDTSAVGTFAEGKSPIRINSKHSVEPNSLVANGELIRDENGNVSEVKGGKGGHIDDVPANIKPTDAILSNKTVNPTTGNTFAEDGKKLTNMEKRMNRNIERNKSIIARNTERLNKAFIDRSWDNLISLQNAPVGDNTFADGKTGSKQFELVNPWVHSAIDAVGDGVQAALNSDKWFGRFNGRASRINNLRNQTSNVVNPIVPFPTSGNDQMDTSVNLPNVEIIGSKPSATATTVNPIKRTNLAAPVKKPKVQEIKRQSFDINPLVGKSYGLSTTASAKPETIGTRLSDNFTVTPSQSPVGRSVSMENLAGVAEDLTTLAPTIYNMIRGSKSEPNVTADQLYAGNPYESMILNKLSKLKYNPNPEMTAVRDAEARAKYNARLSNTAGGVGRAIDTASALASRRAISDIKGKEQVMNAQYAQQLATAMQQLGSQKSAGLTQAMQQAFDINMKNKAASKNAIAQALSQLSQFSQTKKQEKNMAKRDEKLAKALEMYARLGMSQQDINSLIGK